MKKRIGILVLTLGLMVSGMQVQAASKNTQIVSKYFNLFMDEIKGVESEESLSALVGNMEELIGNVKQEDAKKIFDFINEKIEEGKWDSEKGIEEAIAEGEKEFNVTLTKEQKDMILSVISKIKKLGITPEYVMEQAEKIYEKYGTDLKNEISENSQVIMEEAQNMIKEEIDKSVKNYFSDMVNSVKTFFRGIFSK